jgi:hypothetical protein
MTKELQSDIITELENYLKEFNYDDEIKKFFYEAFKHIYYAYNEFNANKYDRIDPNDFAIRNLNTLKKIGKIEFIRDINKNEFLTEGIIGIDKLQKPTIGYIKDKTGHFQISSNPKYWPSMHGSSEKGGRKVDILFDGVSLNDEIILYAVFFHELVHIEQKGYKLYSQIMNLKLFYDLLTEGHAMMTVRFLKRPSTDLCDIPFSIDFENNKYTIYSNHIDYGIYRYIYFKFQFLLGKDFMNEWANNSDSEHYLELAYRKIDTIYGTGTFQKLYIYIELILTAFNDNNGKNKTIKKKKNNQYQDVNDIEYINILNKRYNYLYNLLHDETVFDKNYQIEKERLKDIIKLNAKYKGKTNQADEMLKTLTKEKLRESYEEEFLKINYEKNKLKFYEMINTCNQQIYSIIDDKKEYLTKAIVDLELLMMDCLNSVKHEADRNNMFDYYDYNVFSNKFYSAMMFEVMKRYDKLDYRAKGEEEVNSSNLKGLNKLLKEIHK